MFSRVFRCKFTDKNSVAEYYFSELIGRLPVTLLQLDSATVIYL